MQRRGGGRPRQRRHRRFGRSWPPCWSKCAGARRCLAHDRERSRVLLAALLDRLPDLRPEVRHVSHRHVHRDEGEDGLAEGEWATQEALRRWRYGMRRWRDGDTAAASRQELDRRCSAPASPSRERRRRPRGRWLQGVRCERGPAGARIPWVSAHVSRHLLQHVWMSTTPAPVGVPGAVERARCLG